MNAATEVDNLHLAMVRLRLMDIPYRMVTRVEFLPYDWPWHRVAGKGPPRILLVCDYAGRKSSFTRYFYITPDGVEHDFVAGDEALLAATQQLDPTMWLQSGTNR